MIKHRLRRSSEAEGRMSLQAFSVRTCREEQEKKHPDASVSFSVFLEVLGEMEQHVC